VTALLPASTSDAEDDSERPECSECYKAIGADEGGLCEACREFARSEAGNQLAGRLSVSELVSIYERSESEIATGCQMIARAVNALNDAFTLDSYRGICFGEWRRQINFEKPVDEITELRRSIWKTLVERLELRRAMSIKAWEQLEEQLKKGEVLPITEANVAAMVKQFQDQLPSMIEAAIDEVFEWLRPHNSEYKTNSEFEVPAKVVLSGVVELPFHGPGMRVSHWAEQRLTALENVFSALAGLGNTSKRHYSELSDAIKVTPRGEFGETQFFRFRAFKNRNLHLEFRRLDLLEKLNRAAGGTRLRPKKHEEI